MMETKLKVTEGIMLDVPTYNRLRSVEKFYDSGPNGPRVVVTLVFHAQQAGLVVPTETTFGQLAACLGILSGKDIYEKHLLIGADHTMYEPNRTLEQERIQDGYRLFGVLRHSRSGDKGQQ